MMELLLTFVYVLAGISGGLLLFFLLYVLIRVSNKSERKSPERFEKPQPMTQAERENYNQNEAAACFWGGATEYKDCDGNWRKL